MKTKHLSISFLFLTCYLSVFSQISNHQTKNNYYRLVEASENPGKYRVELFSDINSSWDKWNLRGYSFGFDPKFTPMYTTVKGIISTPYMIQVRGNENEKNRKRWGYHVFEGYASDDKSRITLLVNKHVENERPVAEMYYYGTEYNHSEKAYNWFRIGSDVQQHSFLFSRDKAIFYGSVQLTNALTLGNIGKNNIRKEKPEGDDESNFEESARHVNYKALKESGDGTIFYDSDNDIIVIKIKGKWMKFAVEPLPEDIKYEFE